MQPLHTTFQIIDRSTADGTVLSSRAVGPVTALLEGTMANMDALRRRGEEDPVFPDEVQTTVERVPSVVPQLRPAR